MKSMENYKAGPVLQVMGALIFWSGSMLPFVVTWGGSGFWVVSAGLVLGCSPSRQQAPRDL
jgi:hypothetical protein